MLQQDNVGIAVKSSLFFSLCFWFYSDQPATLFQKQVLLVEMWFVTGSWWFIIFKWLIYITLMYEYRYTVINCNNAECPYKYCRDAITYIIVSVNGNHFNVLWDIFRLVSVCKNKHSDQWRNIEMRGPIAGYYDGPHGLHGYEEHTKTQRLCVKAA